MPVVECIQKKLDTFSPSEKKVAQFILKNPKTVETYTITRIATLSHASTSAVLRFCQTLGYNGYKDFRFAMIADIRAKALSSQQPVEGFLKAYSETVSELHLLEPESIKALAASLCDDHLNIIVGIFLSSLPAKALQFGLESLSIPSICTEDLNHSAHINKLIHKDTTFVYFSISGSTDSFLQSFKEIQQDMPKNSFLITLNPRTSLKKLFSHTIILPGRFVSQQSIIDLQSIPLLFVELLINAVHDYQAEIKP